ncbi:MAG: TonB-dependent receptor [Bacteroidetes bacterium]|nr:TonB-dependent receptor [Bacteroidota bacterium]
MMKRSVVILLLLMLCSVSVFAQHKKYNITGQVLDSISKKPLMGVYVTTDKIGGQTDKNGCFTIKNVPQGEVKLSTMYYSSYPTVRKNINLSKDTTVNFLLNEQLLHMGQVVITGTRTERHFSEAPVLTTIISEREIEKSASVSALEALQDNIPGIIITPNGMGDNMRIKGLNSRYILILVDGERLVSEGAGGNINLNQIGVDNIKKIEMINGASSALYGANAVGAVINIITKNPIHKIEAGAKVSYQNNNTLKTMVDVGSNLKKISTRASAFRNSSDGFGGDGDDSGAYAARYADYGGNLKFGYKPVERADINFVGRFFRHETFNPEESMSVSHSLTNKMSVGLNGGYKSLNSKNNLRVSINYDNFLDYDVLEQKSDEKSKKNSAGYFSTRAVNTFRPNEKWEVVGGIEYNYEKNYATKTLGSEPTTKSIDDVNLFGQAEYEFLKNFDVVAGARYTYNTQFKSALTPKLSLKYSVAGFNFRGGVGTAFRAPSIKELYYDFNHNGMFWIYGNPNLKAEKGVYLSLSAEYTKGLFNASVSGYYNDITNKITQYDVINSMGGNEKYYVNVSSATIRGVDLNASYLFFRELELKGNYSFCDAKDNSTGLQLSSNVKHSATLSATWNGKIARSPFSLQFAGRLNSPKLYQEKVIDDSGSEVINRKESKKYSIWKAVLVKPFRINKNTIEVTLKVDNIFDFKESSFVNPGRQYLIGLRYSFK